jgi:uncharacterized protein YdbL (DUF1318 family)
LFSLLLLSACVTINVYFPAAAAEEAADRIIRDVYGTEPAPAPAQPAEPTSGYRDEGRGRHWLISSLEWVVPPARAAGVDIDVQSPGIQRLEASMAQRHQQLKPFYESGAVGMTRNGEIAVRDLNAVPLKDRKQVNQLVGAESRDRSALYKEIARVNGHPEWEDDIRQTFARRWVANAPGGWWYQDAQGSWTRK